MKYSVKTALSEAARQMEAVEGIDHFLEANILLAHVLNKPRSWLFAWPEHELNDDQLAQFRAYIERRSEGEPISYITKTREFYNLDIEVSTHTLIPRHETELLVDTALEILQTENTHVLELGTGSGAITAALASQRPQWRFLATDVYEETLKVAQYNFDKFQINAETRLSNWFENIPVQEFDLIISNPPYIESNDPHLQQGDLRFEPQQALASGADGLDDIRLITAGCRQYLKTGGYLMLEHGFNQKSGVQQLFHAAGLENIETRKDLQGNDRLTLGQAK